MLEPAIKYKEQLERLFKEQIYTDDYFYYTGYCYDNEIPDIRLENELYQYAITQEIERASILHGIPCIVDTKVIGYLSYRINGFTDTVDCFGLYSFDRGNPLIGLDLKRHMEQLIRLHRRIEWKVISGNPVEEVYDKFCKKYNGNKVILHDVTKDKYGKYHNEIFYEIVKGWMFHGIS